MNLIDDAWIPVRLVSGKRAVIAPWQIAQGQAAFPDWPRTDMNLACFELLIGMVYIALPRPLYAPFEERPDAQELRAALENWSHAFELLGQGPRFMQELGGLDGGNYSPPDMLFIDSAGESTAKKNQDVMVHRGRYGSLDLPTAAMALYTLQQFAPSGGAGNRTSMRGGGPMITLVEPEGANLWDIVWANTPNGEPLGQNEQEALPWMRDFASRQKDKAYVQIDDSMLDNGRFGPNAEVFFGQPRRIMLDAEEGRVVGVWQKPYGNNYQKWVHPLTPYYKGPKGDLLPRLAKPGRPNYASWVGLNHSSEGYRTAQSVADYQESQWGNVNRLLMGGWAMSNMTPQDFQSQHLPFWHFDDDAQDLARRLIEASRLCAKALVKALLKAFYDEKSVSVSGRCAAWRDYFFAQTQTPLMRQFDDMVKGSSPREEITSGWLRRVLKPKAIEIFDHVTQDRLLNLTPKERENVTSARSGLLFEMSGYRDIGKSIFSTLQLAIPVPKRKDGV